MPNQTPKSLGPWVFFFLVLAFSALAFFFPFGNWRDAKIMTSATTTSDTVVMAGTSVLKHISLCDADQRHVTAMMSERLGRDVADLSYGGQTIVEEAAYVGSALRNAHVQVLLASASVADFTPPAQPALRRRILFALASPANALGQGHDDLSLSELVLGRDLPLTFDYGGEHFASYDEVKRKHLAVEQAHAVCPETDGHDMRFVEAYYYGTYIARAIDPAAIALMARTGREARARGKIFYVVLQPIDFELIGRLNGAWPDWIRHQKAQLVAALEKADVPVIDVTDAVPNAGFADRWCACGHLQSQGRQLMADAIARQLRARAPAPPASR